MPIAHRIDPERRLVAVRMHGVLTDAEIFDYQREVGSQASAKGYRELIDMTDVTRIELPSVERVRDLAELAASSDVPAESSRFAIVAPDNLSYGLGRMFQSQREVANGSCREVGVFRTTEEALSFLGIEGPVEMPPIPPEG